MIKKWKKYFILLFKQMFLLIYYAAKKKWTFAKTTDKKRIIICFDGAIPHGGLVDRLKGIISFYEVAKKLDYDFYINFKDPFELKLFLEPNKVSWEIRNEDLKFNFFESKIFYLMNNFTINPISLIENCSYKTIIVYCNVDYLKTIYNDKKQEDLNEIWRLNYNELFIESDFLINQINELPTKKGIVFHTRFTSLMGDFKDTVSVVLDENARKELLLELVEKIQEKSIFNPTKKIYVVSDSILFLNYIKENTSFNVLPGIPKHIDLNDFEKDLTPHLKTFTDFYFMVKSEKVYLLKLGQMYSSNFSRYAAILGKVSFSILKK